MAVFLVGAGPGDPDLLTIRAAHLLSIADVLVHDRLISEEILALVGAKTQRIDVGKVPGLSHSQPRINELLVKLGREFECVVRLKGGDPFVFGRGGEEAQVLVEHGLEVHVIPGVSSAFAAPLLAGIPVTHRGLSHGVSVVTGSSAKGSQVDFTRLANPDMTLVVLMGVERRGDIARQLVQGALSPTTPVAVIQWASTSEERCVRCALDELEFADVTAPAVMVIGAVAALDVSHVRGLVEVLTSPS